MSIDDRLSKVKYVTDENGESVTLESFESDDFTIDDIVLIIKRFAGISG